jgi:hypothetical protein
MAFVAGGRADGAHPERVDAYTRDCLALEAGVRSDNGPEALCSCWTKTAS